VMFALLGGNIEIAKYLERCVRQMKPKFTITDTQVALAMMYLLKKSDTEGAKRVMMHSDGDSVFNECCALISPERSIREIKKIKKSGLCTTVFTLHILPSSWAIRWIINNICKKH